MEAEKRLIELFEQIRSRGWIPTKRHGDQCLGNAFEDWVGKDLIMLNLRKAYGVNIIAVRYNDGRIDVSPSPTREFNAGEIVSIVGDDSDIEKMTAKIK